LWIFVSIVSCLRRTTMRIQLAVLALLSTLFVHAPAAPVERRQNAAAAGLSTALNRIPCAMLGNQGTLWNVPDVVPATRVTPRCSMALIRAQAMANSRTPEANTDVASSFPGMSDTDNPLASLLSGLQSGLIHLRRSLGSLGLRWPAPSISRS